MVKRNAQIPVAIIDEFIRLLRESFFRRVIRADRSRVYFSFEQTFRYPQTRFCQTDWAARVRRRGGAVPTRDSENNHRRDRATGLPASFYSSECVSSSAASRHDVTDPISRTPAVSSCVRILLNQLPPDLCIGYRISLYLYSCCESFQWMAWTVIIRYFDFLYYLYYYIILFLILSILLYYIIFKIL